MPGLTDMMLMATCSLMSRRTLCEKTCELHSGWMNLLNGPGLMNRQNQLSGVRQSWSGPLTVRFKNCPNRLSGKLNCGTAWLGPGRATVSARPRTNANT